jgi:hypothetical protein
MIKLGASLGPVARDEMVAHSEGISIAEATKERLAAEKAARRAAFEKDLLKRLPELIAWARTQTVELVRVRGADGYWTTRPTSEPCSVCAKGRAYWADRAEDGPQGLVVFSQDIPIDVRKETQASERHDRYHIEVAYTAIRKAEYESRAAKRGQRNGSNHKAFASKAVRQTLGDAETRRKRQERRELDRARSKKQGCGRKVH